MTPPNEVDLERLEALAKAATPGPWVSIQGDYVRFVGEMFFNVAQAERGGDMVCPGRVQMKNADFIAACSPEVILGLIAALRSARAELDESSRAVRKRDALLKRAHELMEDGMVNPDYHTDAEMNWRIDLAALRGEKGAK